MAAVLIRGAFPMLRLVVGIHVLRRGLDHCAHIDDQVNVAQQMNGAAQKMAGRDNDSSAAGVRSGLNRFVNCRTIEIFSVTDRAVAADIKIAFVSAVRSEGLRKYCLRKKQRRDQ